MPGQRILITGHKGRLGGKLADLLRPDHDVIGLDLPEMDLGDPASVARLADARPDLVLHCAAWTDVDGCAEDPDRAMRANAYGTKHVALACARLDVPLVYISTNEVFDGAADRPYREYDRANPINPYGYSKWAGEQIVRELLPRHYIARPSWVIARGGRNFLHAILDRATSGQPLKVVTDEIATPTYNDHLAPAIIALAQTGHYGTYHLVNEGYVSRWGLARFALDEAGYADVEITPITLADWPRPSTVPPFAPLRNQAAALLGITLPPWQDGVRTFLQREGLA